MLGPTPELVPRDLEIVDEATQGLRPEALRRMAMNGDLLSRSIGDHELRRAITSQVGAEELEEVDQLAVLELGERRQVAPRLRV